MNLSVTGRSKIGCLVALPNDHFFYARNPQTQNTFPIPFYQASNDEVNEAVQQAAAISAWFSDSDIRLRAELLVKIADKMRKHEEVLKKWYLLETGLPAYRADVEFNRSIFQFQSYAQALLKGVPLEVRIDEGDPARLPNPKPDLRKMNSALGPVAVFGASNFPFAYSTLGGDVAGALAAGCPVIVKAHNLHPHTSECSAQVITEALEELAIDQGVFSHLFSSNFSVGEQLVMHPEIKAVGFTGSINGGKALMNLAHSRKEQIPVFAEMGSSNPIVVCDSAMRENATEMVQQITQSVSLNAGQFCTSPGLLFYCESNFSESFVSQLIKAFEEQPAQTMLGESLFENYLNRSKNQLKQTQVLHSGKIIATAISPSLTRVEGFRFVQQASLQEEIFGSFLTLVACKSIQELREAIGVLHGQLTGTIFTNELQSEPEKLLFNTLKSKVGRLIINGVPTGVEVATAMHHGGPFPCSSHAYFTAVGPDSIKRFMRPISFQNCPDELLPDALKKENPLQILRFVNGIES